MAAPFAAIETATAFAAVAALANVTATIGAVTGVECIFDSAYQDAFGLVAGTSPVLLFASSAAPSAAVGNTVVVGGTSYTIAGLQPDGTGMTRLVLQEA